jgi:hypothetical protein
MLHLGLSDIFLISVISLQAAGLAYVRQPRRKAFLLSLPVPFTLMTLTLGRPIDASNVLGLVLLLLFTHGVRVMHQQLHIAIIPSIALSALGYLVLGALAVPVLPRTELAFWLIWAFVSSLGAILYLCLPERTEPEHRTQVRVWMKIPMIVLIVALLIMVRNSLQGFATVFPMVGVIAVYESRHSLWTIGRQIPVIMMSMGSMMAVTYLTQSLWGLSSGLIAGWSAFLVVFGLLTLHRWLQHRHFVRPAVIR